MERISDQEQQDLKDKFLNQRISVIDSKGTKWVGECSFIGYNEFFPSFNFQVTIDRTPVPNVIINSIHIIETQSLF